MKSRWDDGVVMNPWSSQQQIIWGVSVNDIACHLGSQVPNLAPKFDLSHRARTIGVEIIDDSFSGTQSVGGDPQVLHDSTGHNAQHESWINLNATHFRWSDIHCIIQMSIMFFLDLHIFRSKCYEGKTLRGLKTMSFILLFASSRNLGDESLWIG